MTNARRASIALFTAFVALPAAARADSITMPMLGLKQSLAPGSEEWRRGVETSAATAIAARRPFVGSKIGVSLDFPGLLTSRRTLPTYVFDKDAFVKPSSSFGTDDNDGVDGRRSRSNSGGAGGAGGAGGSGGSASRSTGPELTDYTSGPHAFHTDTNGRLRLGGSNELLDDGIETSLEAESTGQQSWGGGSSGSAGAGPDALLNVPVSSALLDVKDEGQFAVYDFVSGDPVWTTDSLDDLLEKGSLSTLVPNFDGSIAGAAAVPNPEPASLVLFASGLIGAGMRWRAKRRQRDGQHQA
jgi:hypothetical protein